MTERLIRIYKPINIQEIKKQLLICGVLSAQCSACSSVGLKIEAAQCPECQAEFSYIAFQNVKDHYPKIQKIIQERPDVTLVDYDDFKRLSGALKAEEFLK